MRPTMAMGVVGAGVVGAAICVTCWAAAAPEKAAKPVLPIIPGAAGFGMETPAGSGRHLDVPKTTVYKVTNLNAAGPGSLREALEAKGPRVVVFEVSGNIDFTPYGNLSIKEPYVTIAGQTAPSPGITLKACELFIGTHDVLVQHIRIRVGDLRDPKRPVRDEKSGWTQWSERDATKVGGERIVIDHCSFSWATDENVQSRACDTTFRHNIFSEGLCGEEKHHKGAHSKGLLILDQSPVPGNKDHRPGIRPESQNVAIIGNLFAHNHGRNPSIANGPRAAVINNLIYNAYMGIEVHIGHERFGAWAKDRSTDASVIGNHVIEGFHTRNFGRQDGRRNTMNHSLWLLARPAAPPGRAYIADYRVSYLDAQGKEVSELVGDPWNSPFIYMNKSWMGEATAPLKSKVAEPPVIVPGLTIRRSDEVQDWTLASAGARPADRDPMDARIVLEVRQRTGKIPESQEDVGGWPNLRENRRELTLPEDPNGDDDGDGYTNLEEWLHGFAAKVEGR